MKREGHIDAWCAVRFLLSIALSFGLISCSNVDYSKEEPSKVSTSIRVIDSEFDTHRILLAPQIHNTQGITFKSSTRLSAAADKSSGNVTYSVNTIWEYRSDKWFFLSAADLSGGKSLQSLAPKRSVISCASMGCTYQESMTSLIELQDLATAHDGLKIRYKSNQGHHVVELPKNYILGFLQGIPPLLSSK